MKYKNKFSFGRIIEGFVILPSFNVNWLTHENKQHYELQFSWLFWYVTYGNITSVIESFK